MACSALAQGGVVVAGREGALRWVAAVAALVAGGIHVVLAFLDLIPGEPTRGPLFAVMGVGYVASAVALLARRATLDGLIALYAVGLVLAYAVSRDELPVEPIGLATKAAEVIVATIAASLAARGR